MKALLLSLGYVLIGLPFALALMEIVAGFRSACNEVESIDQRVRSLLRALFYLLFLVMIGTATFRPEWVGSLPAISLAFWVWSGIGNWVTRSFNGTPDVFVGRILAGLAGTIVIAGVLSARSSGQWLWAVAVLAAVLYVLRWLVPWQMRRRGTIESRE